MNLVVALAHVTKNNLSPQKGQPGAVLQINHEGFCGHWKSIQPRPLEIVPERTESLRARLAVNRLISGSPLRSSFVVGFQLHQDGSRRTPGRAYVRFSPASRPQSL